MTVLPATATPADDGFAMPAEWGRHARTWMCWPCRLEAWGGRAAMFRAQRAVSQVAFAVAAFEPVTMVAPPLSATSANGLGSGPAARDAPASRYPVETIELPLDDSWARDTGPTWLSGPGRARAAVAWRFNAWGGKYWPYDKDAQLAARLAERTRSELYRAPIICEGGAIHSDGAGTLLTTEQCVLNPNRNRGLTKEDATRLLCGFTGASRVIWLGDGFSDTETDGHVDNIACFAAPGKVIAGVPDSRSHPDHAPVMEAIRRLKAEGMEVIELVQPRTPRPGRHGGPLPASYVNFYLCNGGLVMPSFDDPNDEAARGVLADCFPDRAIVQVPALDIVAGGGGIHCITQQEPA